ncbi:MAG: prepilin-type N-terminal cleavage/methylation domain-containing protein [Candidatus Saccharibacteria bacterium]
MKNFKKDNKGFTIIEVLIVLAIAGLILLVVFLAVPALQRNARTTSKRSDISKALGAAAEFSSNNDGKVPKTADIASIATLANLSSATTINALIPTTVATVVAPASSEVEIGTGLICNPAAVHVTAVAPTAANFQQEVILSGSLRSIVAIYSVESAGGQNITQCTSS